jgi:glycosyltransferase involved in cell wall biosynthesis
MAENATLLPIAGDCILFATADWDTSYWTNKQHTARHLAKAGYRVLYIESIGLRSPTISGRDLSRIWRRLRRGMQQPRLVEPNVWVLSPLAIPFKQHWAIIRRINQGWLSLRVKIFMLRHGFKLPMVWTYHPFILETIASLNHGPLVYHCVDDLSAIPGIDAVAFNCEEQRLLKKCQSVFVTSEALEEKCLAFNSNTHYFANVADIEHFSQAYLPKAIPSDLAKIPSPRIGYIGALSDFKVDFSLILDIACNKPDWHWVLIGDEREGQHSPWVGKLMAMDNVHFLGHRAYEELPEYLRGIDVGTLPTLLNDYTRAMFPMKYFEYLAAGVPVVSTPLEFTKQHKGGLSIASDPDAFGKAIANQLANGRFTESESVNLVGYNTWTGRLRKMLQLIELQQLSSEQEIQKDIGSLNE